MGRRDGREGSITMFLNLYTWNSYTLSKLKKYQWHKLWVCNLARPSSSCCLTVQTLCLPIPCLSQSLVQRRNRARTEAWWCFPWASNTAGGVILLPQHENSAWEFCSEKETFLCFFWFAYFILWLYDWQLELFTDFLICLHIPTILSLINLIEP